MQVTGSWLHEIWRIVFKIEQTVVLSIIKYNIITIKLLVPNRLEGTLKGIRLEGRILKIVRDLTLLTSKCSESSDMPILK